MNPAKRATEVEIYGKTDARVAGILERVKFNKKKVTAEDKMPRYSAEINTSLIINPLRKKDTLPFIIDPKKAIDPNPTKPKSIIWYVISAAEYFKEAFLERILYIAALNEQPIRKSAPAKFLEKLNPLERVIRITPAMERNIEKSCIPFKNSFRKILESISTKIGIVEIMIPASIDVVRLIPVISKEKYKRG